MRTRTLTVPVETFSRAEALALTLSLAVTSLLIAIVLWDFQLAAWMVVENGPAECTQVALLLVAGALRVRDARRCASRQWSVAPDVVLASGFAVLVIGEIDLDKAVFGTKVIHTRFFVNPSVWLPYRVLAVMVVVGLPIALGLYVLRHLRELLLVLWRGRRTGWGRLYLAGGVLFILVEIFERRLLVSFLPRYFLEELLELISAIMLVVASLAQPLGAGLQSDSPDEIEL